MNKLYIKKQGASTFVVTKLKRGQELNTREIEILSRQVYGQFLTVKIEGKKLIYNISALTTLEEVIGNNISVQGFFTIIAKVVELLKITQEAYLYNKNVVFDPKYIYVYPQNGGLAVIYVPILNYDHSGDVKEFLKQLAYRVRIQPGEDTTRIAQFLKLISGMITFSILDVQNFLQNVANIRLAKMPSKTTDTGSFVTGNQGTKRCMNCNESNTSIAKFCNFCGSSLDTNGESSMGRGYTPTVPDDNTAEKRKKSQGDVMGTTLLGEDDYFGTTILSQDVMGKISYPYLIRLKTGEKYFLDKPVFRIGKEKSFVDCFIADNGAISRGHADIITRDNQYFVVDRNSTNGTFLNGRIIPAEKECQIMRGQRLQFANEEFQFDFEE